MGKFSENRLKLSTFKLNALLDITLAINDNVSTSELIRRYDTLVPVLCLGDTEICHYFFDESALIAALPLA